MSEPAPDPGSEAWADRLAIIDLVQRYSDAVSHNRWDAVEATFAPDCVLDLVVPFPMRVEGGRAIRDALEERCRDLDLLFQTSVQTVVDLEGPGQATASTLVNELMNQPGVFSMEMRGIYHDRLRKDDGVWRFTHREFRGVYADRTILPGRVLTPRSELP